METFKRILFSYFKHPLSLLKFRHLFLKFLINNFLISRIPVYLIFKHKNKRMLEDCTI